MSIAFLQMQYDMFLLRIQICHRMNKNPSFLFFWSSCLPPPSFRELSVSLVLLLRLVFTREQLCLLVLRILCDSHSSEKFSTLSDTAGANPKSSTDSENYLVSATKSQMVQL